MENIQTGKLAGGVLLVAGTAIGGGMLALPVITAAGGFFPAIFIYAFCWIFMASTATLLAEVCLSIGPNSNLVSMALKTLGRGGAAFAWGLYLFLFYSLTTAYIGGGGQLAFQFFPYFLPDWVAPVCFVLCFAPFVIAGSKPVDRINRVLMTGLIFSFVFFVVSGARHVNPMFLKRTSWPEALLAMPVMFSSFAFQGVVPTLTTYLNQDRRKIKQAIWIGSSIPLLIYILWEWLILGVVPIDALNLAAAEGQSAVAPLKMMLGIPMLAIIGQTFAFFAIVTSFIGVTLGLFDFLADGLKLQKTNKNRAFLSALIFLPPLFISMTNPFLFLVALKWAGGIGCALLLGLLPILMSWKLRSLQEGNKKFSLLRGGKPVLGILLIFLAFELCMMLVTFN